MGEHEGERVKREGLSYGEGHRGKRGGDSYETPTGRITGLGDCLERQGKKREGRLRILATETG